MALPWCFLWAPILSLSWAACTVRTGMEEEKTTVYRCKLNRVIGSNLRRTLHHPERFPDLERSTCWAPDLAASLSAIFFSISEFISPPMRIAPLLT